VFLKLKKRGATYKPKKKKIVKPPVDAIRSRVYDHTAGLYAPGADAAHKSAMDWLCEQLYKCSIIKEDFARTKESIAIVPVTPEDFAHANHASVLSVMSTLNFSKPSQQEGTVFWRIPTVYKADDIDEAKLLIEEGMALSPRNTTAQDVEMKEAEEKSSEPVASDATVNVDGGAVSMSAVVDAVSGFCSGLQLGGNSGNGKAEAEQESSGEEDAMDVDALDALANLGNKRFRITINDPGAEADKVSEPPNKKAKVETQPAPGGGDVGDQEAMVS